MFDQNSVLFEPENWTEKILSLIENLALFV